MEILKILSLCANVDLRQQFVCEAIPVLEFSAFRYRNEVNRSSLSCRL